MLKKHLLSYTASLVFLALTLLFTIPVSAAEASWSGTAYSSEGFDTPAALSDGDYNSYTMAWTEGSVTLSRTDGISSLYLVFDRIPQTWTLTDTSTGTSVVCGTNRFLHEFADMDTLFGKSVQTVTLTFPEGTVIADIYAFSEGELPDWVQIWQPPCEEADLLLFTSHSDDEQLFFAGILPLYAGEKGLNVQVAYIVQHFQVYNELNHMRPHEQLNGLWAVGVTNYPVMSDFPDLYSESLDGAISVFASVGVTEDDFASYMTECIRRFKPLVVVSHDPNGEYSHGTHILCTKTLMDILEYTDDPTVYPESADRWGIWSPEKVYLHLYSENQIVLDLDIPLAAFDGKTAFEVTQHGFSYHKSQHWTWFYKWIYGTTDAPITKASQITAYSPCLYGLYYTSVGADILGGDLFENVIPYSMRIPPETEPLETEAFETVPVETTVPETTIAETKVSETEAYENDLPKDETSSEGNDSDTDNSKMSTVLLGLLGVAVVSILCVYAFAIANLNRKSNRKRNSRR